MIIKHMLLNHRPLHNPCLMEYECKQSFFRPSQDKRASGSMESSVFRIPPYHYLHVLDQTTNVTRLETGPQIFVRKDNELVLMNPERMITVPPRHYCIIQNPVVRDDNHQVVFDNLSQVKDGTHTK